MLRHHDSRFRDQPTRPASSYDTEDRIRAACCALNSIESVHHVLLHCPACARSRASLRAEIACLSAAQGSPPILTDEEGIVAFLRDDFMGGPEEAASAMDAFLHASFRNLCVEQFGG